MVTKARIPALPFGLLMLGTMVAAMFEILGFSFLLSAHLPSLWVVKMFLWPIIGQSPIYRLAFTVQGLGLMLPSSFMLAYCIRKLHKQYETTSGFKRFRFLGTLGTLLVGGLILLTPITPVFGNITVTLPLQFSQFTCVKDATFTGGTDGTYYYVWGDNCVTKYGGPSNAGGATGTSDSSVFQTAINALGSGLMVIREGSYPAFTLTVPNNARLELMNGATGISYTSTATNAFIDDQNAQKRVTVVNGFLYTNGLQPTQEFQNLTNFVGYYPMDECAGALILDNSGFGNEGEAVNAPTWNTLANGPFTSNSAGYAVFGCGLHFVAGSSQYVVTAGAPLGISTASHDFSIGAWIKTSASAAQSLVAIGYANSENGIELAMDSTGHYICEIRGGASTFSVTTTNAYNDGKYHMAYCVFKHATSLAVWVDGALPAEGSTSTSISDISSTTLPLKICADDAVSVNYCSADFDEIRQYYEAMTANKQVSLYNAYPVQWEVGATFQMRHLTVSFFLNSGTTYPQYTYFMSGGAGASNTESLEQTYLPRAAAFYGLHVQKESGSCAGMSVTLRSNGVSQSITVSVTSGTGRADDTTHVVEVASGALVDFQISGTCATAELYYITLTMVDIGFNP